MTVQCSVNSVHVQSCIEPHFIVVDDKYGFGHVAFILKPQNLSPMDILREFLESSTIHGLSYISTSKVTYYLMPQLERIVITIYIDIKPAIFRSLVQLHLFAWCVTHYVM